MSSQSETYDTLFLDRDGVLNRKIENGYVLETADIEYLPGIADFLAFAKKAFKRIVVVTNQRCVGRRMITVEEVKAINETINAATGGHIDAFFVCPHLAEDDCGCRKPKTGLFLQALAKYPAIDFKNSWLIGDSVTDLIPAKQLNIHTVFISPTDSPYADHRVASPADLLPLFK